MLKGKMIVHQRIFGVTFVGGWFFSKRLCLLSLNWLVKCKRVLFCGPNAALFWKNNISTECWHYFTEMPTYNPTWPKN